MPHSKREIMAVTERRAKVAELLAKGYRQIEIADALGLGRGSAGQMAVSRDLKAIKDAWKTSGVRDFEADRARLLEELSVGKREAWAAWDQSKEDKEGNPCKPDVKFFNALLDCWEREANLLGLSLPDLIVSNNTQQVPTVNMSPEEKRQAVIAILTAANRGWTGGPESEAGQLLSVVAEQQPNPNLDSQIEAQQPDDMEPVPYGLRELPNDALSSDVQPLWESNP
jgi:hypothetical protein